MAGTVSSSSPWTACIPFELSIPVRIFGTARTEASRSTRWSPAPLDGGPVRTDADFSVTVEHGAEALATRRHPRHPAVRRRRPRAGRATGRRGRWRARSPVRPGTRIVSICTGAVRAGRRGPARRPAGDHALERRRRTSSACSPQVEVDPDVLFVDDGDVLTAAGVAAGIDLCLHLVRRDHGSEVANQVARLCVVPPWRDGGQAQYIERPVPEPSATATPSATRAWALEQPPPAALPGRAGRARADERAHVLPPLPRRGRHEPRPLADPATGRAGAASAGDHRPAGGPRRRRGRASAPPPRCASTCTPRLGVSPSAYRRTFRGVLAQSR